MKKSGVRGRGKKFSKNFTKSESKFGWKDCICCESLWYYCNFIIYYRSCAIKKCLKKNRERSGWKSVLFSGSCSIVTAITKASSVGIADLVIVVYLAGKPTTETNSWDVYNVYSERMYFHNQINYSNTNFNHTCIIDP